MSESSEPLSHRSVPGPPCDCTAEKSTPESTVDENEKCNCPKDEHDIVVHQTYCDLFKSETFVFPEEVCECDIQEDIKKVICECYPQESGKKASEDDKWVQEFPCECDLPKDVVIARHVCKCKVPEGTKEALEEWRKNRDVGAMPAVLEVSHPLMQRFQQSLREFLLKENAIAEQEIVNLKDELRLSKMGYDKDLEDIYKDDHDCNAQRKLIAEYEASLAERAADRKAAEQRAKESHRIQNLAREQLNQDLMTERELRDEMEALTSLCKQLEKWHEETQLELSVSEHVSAKMRNEKRMLADEKRQLDIIIFGLGNEVFKLESKIDMLRKQTEIKAVEMDKMNDKVTAYAAELEDLDLDKRRLVSLWNGVLNNISQRDRIFNSVREDYEELQQHFYTAIYNIDVTKKVITEEINKGKDLAMSKEKIQYDLGKISHAVDIETKKQITLETETAELIEAIDMTDKDQELITMENCTMRNILKTIEKELDHKVNKKLKMENDLLTNLQECLLNNKAVQSMANGIRNMREMSRKQETSLVAMENQHAKLMLDLEILRSRRSTNDTVLQKSLAAVHQKENELKEMEEKYERKSLVMIRKQRELDTIINKHHTLKQLFEGKTKQELRIEALEGQIESCRQRVYELQHDWLRLQGHVVRLTVQYQKVVADINLNRKQLQICEQKNMRIQAESERVIRSQESMDRSMRGMRGRLQMLEKTRKEAAERNSLNQQVNNSITQEHALNLKGAETEIIELEEEIDIMDKEKYNLTQDLDRVQKEALIWQRKGILAVELKKNMKEAKSAAGEIGIMRHTIHRMESRREQLRRTGEKLSEDLAHYVKRRDVALEKTRAHAAVEKAHAANGQVSQSAYHHKLRLVKGDVAIAKKQLNEAEALMKHLVEEQKRLECNIAKTKSQNAKVEKEIANLMLEVREVNRLKQWLLERVVRSQRLGSELAIVVRRQSLHLKKPRDLITKEYTSACALNDHIKYIVECLTQAYPHYSDKMATIANTLEIHSPSGSPRLARSSASSACCVTDNIQHKENIAEKPLCPY